MKTKTTTRHIWLKELLNVQRNLKSHMYIKDIFLPEVSINANLWQQSIGIKIHMYTKEVSLLVVSINANP